MIALLTGAFKRAIDGKQRIAVPKRLRDALFPDGNEATAVLYVAPGTDGSLAIYTNEAFSELADQLAGVSPTGKDVRAFSRLFYARAKSVDMDKQGRVRIPAELVAMAKLGSEAMLIGVRDHMELWDAKLWREYVAAKEVDYDELAERALANE